MFSSKISSSEKSSSEISSSEIFYSSELYISILTLNICKYLFSNSKYLHCMARCLFWSSWGKMPNVQQKWQILQFMHELLGHGL